MRDMLFSEAMELSRGVSSQFDEIEYRPWTIEVLVMELSKQVGDLSQRILTRENYYFSDRKSRSKYDGCDEKIANELADILHQIFRISDYYSINLLEAHISARASEERYIKQVKYESLNN